MRTRLLSLCLPLLVVASMTACIRSPFSAEDVTPPRGTNHGASGIVLTGPDLYEHGGTLLSFLYARVTGMKVDFNAQPCPRLQIRGRKSLMGSTDPLVYVDGARTVNSCVLEMLSTRDLTRVEVYPMGVSLRPGYQAHPNGLILVFVRSGPTWMSEPPRAYVSDSE